MDGASDCGREGSRESLGLWSACVKEKKRSRLRTEGEKEGSRVSACVRACVRVCRALDIKGRIQRVVCVCACVRS